MEWSGAGRAVVMGGGIAGLLAARVLAEHHLDVLVLERDELIAQHEGGPRRGVPQGRHIHALLLPGTVLRVLRGGRPRPTSGDGSRTPAARATEPPPPDPRATDPRTEEVRR